MASSTLSRPLLKQLGEIVGRAAVLTRPGELLAFESDGLTAYRATPAAVVFVHDTDQLQRVVSALHAAALPFVPRGAGTGLSGGALADGAVILELARLNRILWMDAENRRARVQPGVINTQLAEAAAPYGLMYAPDPSSQTACTLGGNVAENSGGPHCLKYGVTTNHILRLTIITPDGRRVELPEPTGPGYDLVGLFVGSEGTLGICSEIEVRLVPAPAAVETLLAHFDAIPEASRAVSAIIAAGVLPAALEMIDRETLRAVEASVYAAGFPTDVAASLIVELDGPRAGLAEQAEEVKGLLVQHGAREVARAADEADRTRFWKARKSAFGAMGRLGSELLVQDATVPRSQLPEVLSRVYEVARQHELTITNVFHAGDGNLHPNIPFDRREPGVLERVHAASEEIMRACVEAGGTITGEHGVGIDKRHYMPLIYSEDELGTMRWVKEAFDPAGLCNPGKIFPDESAGVNASPAAASRTDAGRAPETGMSPRDIAIAVETTMGSDCLADDPEAFTLERGPAPAVATPGSIDELSELMKLAASHRWAVLPAGQGTWLTAGFPPRRIDLVVSTRRLTGPLVHRPDDLLATVAAGARLADLNAELADERQWWPLDPLGQGSVGAAIATGCAGPLAALYGAPRDLVLGLTVVLTDGRVVKAGGRVVKNVAGYDMVKLYTGSWGTLGVIAEAHLRLYALPPADKTRLFSAERPAELTELAAELSTSGRLAPAATEILSPDVARALGLESEGWQLAVRWLGHGRAVADAVGAAEARHGRDRSAAWADGWKKIAGVEAVLDSALTVRVDVPLRATLDVIHAATPFVAGAAPALLGSPSLGRLWVFVPPEVYEEAGVRTWAMRVEELRRDASQSGGSVRVERGSLELRRAVDPWGGLSDALALVEGLKRRFDPDERLKPGFFVGLL